MILILGECRGNCRAAARYHESDIQIGYIQHIRSFAIVFSVRDKDNLSDLGLNVVHRK